MRDPELARDAELLARALRGELGPEDTELEELFRRRPVWRAVHAELAGAPAELLARSRAGETELDRERMRALVVRLATAAPAAHRRWRWPLFLAAAIVALLGAAWWRSRPEPEKRGPLLHGPGLTWVAPRDTVREWGSFAWAGELPRQGGYALTVRSAEGGMELAREDGLRQPHWTPGPAVVRDWPDAIVVTVERLDPRHGVLDALEVRLERSRD